MKKIALAFLGLSIVTLVVYAASTTSVSSVIEKTTVPGATEEQKKVTAQDFNAIVDTVKGIFTEPDLGVLGDYNIGLNVAPIDGIDVNIGGLVRMEPFTSGGVPVTCDNVNAGTMYFNDTNKGFWGCDGTEWKKLNTSICAVINGLCDNSVENGCITGTLNDTPDSWTDYLWECLGVSGGTDDVTCQTPI